MKGALKRGADVSQLTELKYVRTLLSDQWVCLLFCLLANFACTQALKHVRAVTFSSFLISTSFSLGTQSGTARETLMGTFNYSLTSVSAAQLLNGIVAFCSLQSADDG